jgi:hypothetical protein
MAVAKKKAGKIDASEIVVGNRKLDAVLLDLAEQSKENAARTAENAARTARLEEIVAECARRSALAEERSALAEERSARAEEGIELALRTLSNLHRDFMGNAQRTDARLGAVEKAVAAE